MSYKSKIRKFYSIIIFFKIFGLLPFKINLDSRSKKLAASYKLIDAFYNFILLVCIIVTLCFRHLKSSNRKLEIIFINDLAEKVYVMIENITAVIILFSYARNQRTAVYIFERLVELTSDLPNANQSTRNIFGSLNFSHQNLTILIILTHVLLAICSFVLETIYNVHSAWFNLTRALPMFLISAYMIQYALTIIHLKGLFSSMNSSLLATRNRYPTEINDTKIAAENNLRKMRTIYRKLRDISRVISKFNSWPILFVFIHICLALTFNCWKLYTHVNNENLSGKLSVKYLKCLMTVVWIFRSLHPTSTLIISITKLFLEVGKTNKIVSKIIKSFLNNIRITDLAEQFYMELLHNNINFNAFGLFSLDGSILISLLHTAIIHTFIIINYNNKEA